MWYNMMNTLFAMRRKGMQIITFSADVLHFFFQTFVDLYIKLLECMIYDTEFKTLN